MKKIITSIIIALASSTAFANTFSCVGTKDFKNDVESKTNVQFYLELDSDKGTAKVIGQKSAKVFKHTDTDSNDPDVFKLHFEAKDGTGFSFLINSKDKIVFAMGTKQRALVGSCKVVTTI